MLYAWDQQLHESRMLHPRKKICSEIGRHRLVELDFGLVDSKAPARVRVSSPTCERGGAWIVAFRSQFRVISRSQKGSLTHQSIQIVDLAKVVMVECSDGSNRGSVNVMSVRPV